MTDQEVKELTETTKAVYGQLEERRVKGRMDNIPEYPGDAVFEAEVVQQFEKKKEAFKQCLKPEQSPIYFTNIGFMCNCGHLMCDEVLDRKKWEIRLFCTNKNCSENLVTKIVKFPPITDYVLDPSV